MQLNSFIIVQFIVVLRLVCPNSNIIISTEVSLMKINRKLRLSKLKTSFRIFGVYSEGYDFWWIYRENQVLWKILVCFCISFVKWFGICVSIITGRWKLKSIWEKNYFIYKKGNNNLIIFAIKSITFLLFLCKYFVVVRVILICFWYLI